MSTTELRRRAKKTIDEMSGPRLRLITDFLAFMKQQEPDAATRELLEIPGFSEALANGIKDVQAGRVKAWRKVRRDV